MNKQLSDEQVDQLMRSLMSDSGLDESSINEIADSPKLWWQVQSGINRQKAETRSPWPPPLKWLLALGTPVAIAAVLLIAVFVYRPDSDQKAGLQSAPVAAPAVDAPSPSTAAGDPVTIASVDPSVESPAVNRTNPVRSTAIRTVAKRAERSPIRQGETAKANVVNKRANEVKSEFIALSYARDPESGQIVRVKVPSSMMVSLGLVQSVKKPSELVDAEVLVGDDGLSRAIRFIY